MNASGHFRGERAKYKTRFCFLIHGVRTNTMIMELLRMDASGRSGGAG